MEILIKYATRGRPELVKRSLENIAKTIGYDRYIVLVTADIDDVTMNNPDMESYVKRAQNTWIYYGTSKSKVDAINRDMNMVKLRWDILINFSDDMFFIEQDWGPKIITMAKTIAPNDTDFFLHLNDGYVNEKLPTMSIMGRDYYERDNYIYHPDYKSVSCDAEAMWVAMMRGKYFYFPLTLFHHLHPANCPSQVQNDATYIKNDAISHEDTETYFRRKAICFDVKNPVIVPFNPTERV